MPDFNQLNKLRRDFGELPLNELTIARDPGEQFILWLNQAIESECIDANAMVLSTVDSANFPDSRVVLLKGMENNQFIFYTNYQSKKGQQLAINPQAALNFYWPALSRQVRVRGNVCKTTDAESSAYFKSRPLLSQQNAIISPQSQIIPDRHFLENLAARFASDHEQETFECPKHWGGYCLDATEFEFWQGRDNRLHDRIAYKKIKNFWTLDRLAP